MHLKKSKVGKNLEAEMHVCFHLTLNELRTIKTDETLFERIEIQIKRYCVNISYEYLLTLYLNLNNSHEIFNDSRYLQSNKYH